jgi:hypothetical protein
MVVHLAATTPVFDDALAGILIAVELSKKSWIVAGKAPVQAFADACLVIAACFATIGRDGAAHARGYAKIGRHGGKQGKGGALPVMRRLCSLRFSPPR